MQQNRIEGQNQIYREKLLPGGNVLDLHFKLYSTDGVSLQGQELDRKLKASGWKIYQCASDIPEDKVQRNEGLKLDQLSYQSPKAEKLRRRLFTKIAIPGEEGRLSAEIKESALEIEERLSAYIEKNNIRSVHVRNIMSLPLQPAATLALYNLAQSRKDIRFIFHHHDLIWENDREKIYSTPYRKIAELLDKVLYPSLPNSKHIVINPIAQRLIFEKRGIKASLIPDIFDFERPLPYHTKEGALEEAWKEKDRKFRERNDIDENDIIVGMMTRVTKRKNIETAIQFADELKKELDRRLEKEDKIVLGFPPREYRKRNKIWLFLPQKEDLNDNLEYFQELEKYAKKRNVALLTSQEVTADEKYTGQTEVIPFYASYQHVDLVCYPPEHEGFGNQLIEAAWARRPLTLFRYPVFEEYIAPHFPHFASMENGKKLIPKSSYSEGMNILEYEAMKTGVTETINLLRSPNLHLWLNENFHYMKLFCDSERNIDKYTSLYQSS
ncbi:MAG: Glycosyl transferase group 1 [Candidatus Gottesmanbacteria bacterium GW2011_GWC2_39_8]|uniref:Glycosyl transferase group 1 n=1 Tax=Candidatus Gottesmanbacteria bacterium GW2011_GWC2_39_8 TaxID=1618450 RepID=A0A0G0T0V7_9BACT|nr:MAG: Glycosyl transferase group 1 [Candidatus Gottesmanbacteria bacterium GW2011_GWC2_39_8]